MPGTDSTAEATGEAPRLVFGVVSDSHLRTDMDGRSLGTPDRYFRAALECFRERNVDAVVHCGDMADRGQTAELEFHAAIWNEVFPGGLAPDGHRVEKLFVAGNHDIEGFRYGLGCPFRVDVPFPDPEEATRHLLAADLAAEWERIWGEPYAPTWHKVVRGFHFFGLHWGEDETLLAKVLKEFSTQRRRGAEDELSTKSLPFFVIAHDRPERPECFGAASGAGVGFFGHYHRTAANANEIHEFPGCPFPWVQVPSCSIYGGLLFGGDEWIAPVPIEGGETAKKGYQGFVVRVYGDRIAIERHEFSEGGLIGPDWTLPVGKSPVEKLRVEKVKGEGALREEMRQAIGEPQFRAGARLEMGFLATLRIAIPPADANPDCPVYAYEVEVAATGPLSQALRKAIYARGVHMGAGHAPDGGVTALEIPVEELPPGRRFRVTVTPLSSLGTMGRAIAATFNLSTIQPFNLSTCFHAHTDHRDP